MVERVRIEVCKDLQLSLERIRFCLARDIKKKYGLEEVMIPRTLSSQVLASQINGSKTLNFRIKKINGKKGVLEFI